MCISPIRMPNPNFGLQDKGINRIKDCNSAYINIPCGHCAECIHAKQSAITQRVQMQSLSSYLYMVTLTYNNEHLPTITTSYGDSFSYADYSHVQKMFKRIRKHYTQSLQLTQRKLAYIAVSELGSEKGRPHFHLIVSLTKLSTDNDYTPINFESALWDAFYHEWSINVGTRKNPIYEPLFTYKKKRKCGRVFTNFDCQLVRDKYGRDATAAVAYYVSKYITKGSKGEKARQAQLFRTCDPDEAYQTWNIIKSKCYKSLGYGMDEIDSEEKPITNYLLDCVERSLCDPGASFARFYNPTTGKHVPLCRYYKSKPSIYSLETHMQFHERNFGYQSDAYVQTPDYDTVRGRRCAERLDYLTNIRERETPDILAFCDDLVDNRNDEYYDPSTMCDPITHYGNSGDFDDYNFDDDLYSPQTLSELSTGQIEEIPCHTADIYRTYKRIKRICQKLQMGVL